MNVCMSTNNCSGEENVEIEKSFIPILLILSTIISFTSSIKTESSSTIAIFIVLIILSQNTNSFFNIINKVVKNIIL